MYQVAVCDSGEYGSRLVAYLENYIRDRYQMIRFTDAHALEGQEEAFDLCIVDEDMYKASKEIFADMAGLILLSDEEREDCYCRYHPPKELIALMEKHMEEMEQSLSGQRHDYRDDWGRSRRRKQSCPIYGVFVPVHTPDYLETIRLLTRAYETGEAEKNMVMEDQLAEVSACQNCLVISMEDMCFVGSGQPNMTDLCYYIHLRDECIMERIHQFAVRREECDWITDSEVYFDLGELSMEDYRWFFEILREQKDYDSIVIGFGFSAASKPEFFSLFDQITLIDIEGHAALEKLLEKTEGMMEKKNIPVKRCVFRKNRERVVIS